MDSTFPGRREKLFGIWAECRFRTLCGQMELNVLEVGRSPTDCRALGRRLGCWSLSFHSMHIESEHCDLFNAKVTIEAACTAHNKCQRWANTTIRHQFHLLPLWALKSHTQKQNCYREVTTDFWSQTASFASPKPFCLHHYSNHISDTPQCNVSSPPSLQKVLSLQSQNSQMGHFPFLKSFLAFWHKQILLLQLYYPIKN